jgi:transposase
MADAATWKKRVAAWRASGQTAAEYCTQQGLTLSALQRWSHRLRREAQEPAPPAVVRLARVERVAVSSESTAPATVPGVVVEISGARVRVERGADAATVAMVFAALAAGGRR